MNGNRLARFVGGPLDQQERLVERAEYLYARLPMDPYQDQGDPSINPHCQYRMKQDGFPLVYDVHTPRIYFVDQNLVVQ